jgi:multiple sugar transport system substrate-binding protein
MDDNKGKSAENQQKPQPIFETVTVNPSVAEPPSAEASVGQASSPSEAVVEEVQPEEVAPEVATPEQAANSTPIPPPPAGGQPPSMFNKHYLKFALMGAAAGVFILIFVFLMKALLGGVGKKENITLQYWGLWEDKETYAPLIAEYEAKNPNVKIVYQKMAPQDYREKLLARSKIGQGPDIFRFHNTWLPEIQELTAYVPSNIMTKSEFEKTFYPIHQKDLKIKDRYYGLPFQIDGLVLVYNQSLFKKAGIVKPPVTWDDITEDVDKLYNGKDKSGQLLSASIALGTSSNIEHFSDIFGMMLVQNGGSLKELDKPEAAGALESYRKFAEPPTEHWNDSMPNSVTAFIQEKVSMIFVPSWEVLAILAANPDLDLKVATVPRLPNESPRSIANYWVEGVSKNSKNQIEAWKFLKFMIQKENMTKFYAAQTKTRRFGEPYSRVDLGSTLAQDKYVGPVIEEATFFESLPLISRTYDNGMNDEIVKYIENAINSTVQGVSYTEALRVASQGVQQVFTRYKIEQ